MSEPAIGGAGGGGKKKGKGFGKNLNKLIKQQSAAAPPVSSITVGGSGSYRGSSSSSSRTGLLLLSTKKASAASSASASASALSSSVAAAAAAAAAAAGSASTSTSTTAGGGSGGPHGVAGGAAPSSSNARLSAHDALLTAAAVEAGRIPGQVAESSPRHQDAWGVAEKRSRNRQQPAAEREEEAPAAQAQGPTTSTVASAKPQGQQQQGAPQQPVLKPRRGISSSFPRAAPPPQPQASQQQQGGADGAMGGASRRGSGPERQKGPAVSGPGAGSQHVQVQVSLAPSDAGHHSALGKDEKSGATEPGFQTVSVVAPPQSFSSKAGGGAPPRRTSSSGGGDREASSDDDVRATMIRLARERAEKRRAEEEARMREQRERASQRLKELEEKMQKHSSASKTERVSAPGPVADVAADGWGRDRSRSSGGGGSVSGGGRAAPVLERLGRTKQGSGSSSGASGGGRGGKSSDSCDMRLSSRSGQSHNNGAGGGRGSGRSLFDPNRPYSSLVGGTSDLSTAANSAAAASAPRCPDGRVDVLRLQRAAETALSRTAGGGSPRLAPGGSGAGAAGPPGLIHLSSYEDRDRGGRVSSAGPRMLFDPKSGSMVAAPPVREDGGALLGGGGSGSGGGAGGKGGGGGKKDKREKSKSGGGRSSRDSSGSGAVTLLARPPAVPSSCGGLDGRRRSASDSDRLADALDESPRGGVRRRGRKDDGASSSAPSSARKERGGRRGGGEASGGATTPSRGGGGRDRNLPPSGGTRGRGRSGAGSTFSADSDASPRGGGATGQRSLPRTCGVLYRRDGDGRYVCADVCDADQGYGAHSVPGGRARNAEEHGRFLERRRKLMRAIEGMGGIQQSAPLGGAAFRQGGSQGYYNGGTLPPGSMQAQMQFLGKRGIGGGQGRSPKRDAARHHHQQLQSPMYGAYDNYEGYDAGVHTQYYSLDMHGGAVDDVDMMLAMEGTGMDLPGQELEEVFPDEIPLVRAGETVELIIGGDDGEDSPTLQATAAAWAPSEAALAAAAHAATTAVSVPSVDESDLAGDRSATEADDDSDDGINMDVEKLAATAAGLVIDDEDEGEEDDEDLHSSPSFLGLGFDPTENMDSVMMSPAQGPEKTTDPIDLVNLSLDGARGATVSQGVGRGASTNPFASIGTPSTPSQFLGSSTWGTGGSLGGSTPLGGLPPVSSLTTNWDILGAGATSGSKTGENDQKAAVNTDGGGEQKVASFLSLTSLGENTWGTGGLVGGLGGFGGTSLGGAAHSGTNTPTHDKD